ncbi:cobalamin biosynthesis protein [Actinoplanes sp. HUAS TT8]|uniref:cobalamin biosynthesis protein n=1 Tax=Actinoplanes sp. HUAS TT8 TaxID=3447453 RepID=UPI003F51E2F6
MTVGFGARPGVGAADLGAAIEAALDLAGADRSLVTAVATLDRRAAEPGPRALAAAAGWRLLAFSGEELAASTAARLASCTAARLASCTTAGLASCTVARLAPGPEAAARGPAEARVLAAVGTPSVAEAAALLAAGDGAELMLAKRIINGVTVAIARPLSNSCCRAN